MKIIKKVLAVTLIITVMVIGTAMPVNAVSPPIGAVEMLAEGLAMEMGIGAGLEFASASAAQSFAEGLYQAFKDEIDDLLMTASVIYTGVVGGYKLVANIGADLWSSVRDWVGINYDEGVNGTIANNYLEKDSGVFYTWNSGSFYYTDYWGYQYKKTLSYTGSGWTIISYTWRNGAWDLGSTTSIGYPPYTVHWNYGSTTAFVMYGNGTPTYTLSANTENAWLESVVSNGITGTTGIVDNSNHDLINVGSGGRDIGLDLLPVPPTEADIPISESVGFDLTGTLYDDAVGRDYTDVQAVPVEGTNVGSLSEIEYVDTWTEADNYRVNLMQVFPFCIPFDIISLFQAFAAEPVAPVVDYAFIVPSLGVNVPITVDLSIFDTVAAIVRTCELVAFALGLMFITYKVIKW